jgi:hypothetical protein
VATDLLAKIRSEIEERLALLRPLLNEYERLTVAAERLAAVRVDPLAAVDAAAESPYSESLSSKRAPSKRPSAGGVHPESHDGAGHATAALEAPPAPAVSPAPPAETPVAPAAEESPSASTLRRAHPLRGTADRSIKLAMSLRTTPLVSRPTPRPAAKPAPTSNATRVLEQPPAPSVEEAETWAASAAVADRELKRKPASPATVRQAILAALEHGSHTPSELVMVTAMSTPEIRGGLVGLSGRGAIAKVKRRGDGKVAYTLPSVPA